MKGDLVELAMALEGALQGQIDHRHAEIAPYLIEPVAATCVKGGFEIEVAIFAKHKSTAFFVSLESLQFGVGDLNEFGDIVESHHYPNITMASRAFIGAVGGQA